MDSQRVLGHLNIHKRKLSNDDVHDFIDEDLKACKYAKVAEGKESLISCNSEIGTGSSGHLRGTVVQQDAFKRSAVPLQVLYYHKGQWKEFSQDLLPMITQSFTSREACIKFSVANKLYALYFVHMIQVNLYTGFVRSIAWIDSNGHRFFPCRSVEQSFYGYVANLLPRRDSLTVKSDVQQRDLDDIHRMSNLDVSKHVMTSNCSGFAGLGGKLIQLDVSDDDYSFVRDKLLSGLSMLVKGATITGVYENSHAGVSGQAKLQAFSMQESVTKMARGDANIRYAWHGTSKDGVLGILRYGFGQPRVPRNGDAYGVGVYLAPEDSSHVSAIYSDIDENGEQHMLLCKVIMGRMEQVTLGSQQFHPSSEDFDTGIDDATKPKRYIIWSTHMNTHILPLFVISFKLSDASREIILCGRRGKQTLQDKHTVHVKHSGSKDEEKLFTHLSTPSDCTDETKAMKLQEQTEHGICAIPSESCSSNLTIVNDVAKEDTSTCPRWNEGVTSIVRLKKSNHMNGSREQNGPRSPWISFPELFQLLKAKLDPQEAAVLQKLYTKFQVGRLPRNVFVNMIRRMLGDEFLRECIMKKSSQTKSTCSTHSFCG
ncbi:hypothetical protein KP509_03G015900 [Ceratopteris richardii]|uniref:Poly [ADP-ribose] polymerase n=1 Tax=Ceratopteris richardii TaxID=49495 RepID=A0A8T2V1C1_CERRI|nr:hypothetical protein KP509_03G015900 [Ceratopteris richardii]KAH7440905.1 hypothetical protein KP509_03G015900 [Ceratopteris richardii]KAH7440906.1 hypothetical protein KP509_03G015900 [Ceratopteris richardii]KAH7440907.1 hypothetical protein KP509_03G015900 [Ceratopteris richardii]KAH7440908.1 hypothetical protein KP509_03G015900 [Ceratopteris richardii]